MRQNIFEEDILNGLQRQPKELPSKYFYDAAGDKLFQQIMACEDYYLTRSEMEIFKDKTAELAQRLIALDEAFDIIELGAGDASKSCYLLEYLSKHGKDFHYYPIDISGHILKELERKLGVRLPTMPMTCLEGEYFEMLGKVSQLSRRKKVILFLGSNIGNMFPHEANEFCIQLRQYLNLGDIALIGFDLTKNPKKILLAYDDREGLTARFNLNLLKRINTELGGDFVLEQFEHFQTYDPATGACKSYLISTTDQLVEISGESISFAKDEAVFMEISQKYTLDDIESLAQNSDFKLLHSYYDSNKWFTDSYWIAV